MTHAILKKNNFDLAWKTSLNIIGNLASCEIVLYVKFKETQFELTKLVLPDFNVNFFKFFVSLVKIGESPFHCKFCLMEIALGT